MIQFILQHITTIQAQKYYFSYFLAGRHRGRLQSEVDPRTAIDSAGSLPVGVDRRGNSFRSDRTSGRLLRGGPHNASGSDMTDDSISVVSAPPGSSANKYARYSNYSK